MKIEFEKYLQKGYISNVPENEMYNDTFSCYLPHSVTNLDREAKKVRIVFDAASKHNGLLLKGVIKPSSKLQIELLMYFYIRWIFK